VHNVEEACKHIRLAQLLGVKVAAYGGGEGALGLLMGCKVYAGGVVVCRIWDGGECVLQTV